MIFFQRFFCVVWWAFAVFACVSYYTYYSLYIDPDFKYPTKNMFIPNTTNITQMSIKGEVITLNNKKISGSVIYFKLSNMTFRKDVGWPKKTRGIMIKCKDRKLWNEKLINFTSYTYTNPNGTQMWFVDP